MRGLGFVIAIAWVCASVSPVAAQSALDKVPFSASAAELLAAAKGAPTGTDVVILREDNEITVDDRGRTTTRWRLVFAVHTQAGADHWATLTSSWRPAFQNKPSVRARVVDAAGKVAELDPSLISEEARVSGADGTSDRRDLEIPLPRLAPGVVVEEQITMVEHTAPVGGGLTVQTLGNSVPTQSTRVIVSAPANRKVHVVARQLPKNVRPQRTSAGRRQTTTFAIGPLPAAADHEGWVPADTFTAAYIAVSGATSWQAVARDYRAIVDKQIAAQPLALPAALPKTATLESARAILAWLNRNVREADIGMQSSTYVPVPPAEVVKRGAGDGKDKAALLVALLRQTGMRAELALLSTGPGIDTDRDVPSIEAFDHPLVRAVIAGKEIWIDPLDAAGVVGELASYLQGRRALVIADTTTTLAMTPVTASTHNVIREVRTYDVPEQGNAKVTEVSRETGTFEASQREWIRTTSPADLRKSLENYVSKEFAGAKLERYTSTPPDDLSKPFEVTVVATGSGRASSGRDQLDVYLFPADALDRLPDALGDPKADAPARKHDFEIPIAHVYELETRIVVPPGFSMPAAAADKTRTLGTMTLVEKQRVDGRTFVVSFRLDTGKRRITAKEVATVQAAMRAVRKEPALHLAFPNAGVALLERGKVREAIAEVERMIELHPKESLHQGELARAYLAVGAGAAARRAARKAVALEPKSADAYVVLGWVLSHDTLGRRYEGDFDRKGARAALERARVLDPQHAGAASELAMLLERNERGRRFDRGSDLGAAAAAYRAAYEIDKDSETGLSLVRVLLFAGTWSEAEAAALALPAGETRDGLLLAAIAGARGPAEASRTAATLATGAARNQRLVVAGSVLFLTRAYKQAKAVFDDINALPAGSAQARMLGQIVRHDKPAKASPLPQDVAIQVSMHGLNGGRRPALYWDANVEEELRQSSRAGLDKLKAQDTMTTLLIEDMLRSVATTKVDGDANAWRVELEIAGTRTFVYMAGDRGGTKAIGSIDKPEGVGRHVLRLLAKKDEKTAARLLDWLEKDAPQRDTAFSRVWGPKLPRTRAAMELAAAVLADDTMLDRTIPILERCGATTTDGQFVCDLFLAAAYRGRKQWSELDEHCEAWMKRATHSSRPSTIRALALARLGRFDEADKLLEGLAAAHPDDLDIAMTSSEVAIMRGQLGEAVKRLRATLKPGRSSALVYNNLAWLELVEGSDLAGALAHGQKAIELAATSSNALHTLASIEAELGNVHDAWKHAIAYMAAAHEETPSEALLYVHGRVLEQLGLTSEAAAAYRRVKPSSGVSATPDSGELAARRLKILGAPRK